MPILPYLEIPIVKHCNLNCKYCSHLANVEKPYFMSLERFEKDLRRMAELFSDVTELRLLGGEPLLHPEIGACRKIARKIFPCTLLKVVTNGVLIPAMKGDVMEEISSCDVCFDISLYPPTQKIEPLIRRKLYDYGVRFYLSDLIESFGRRLLAEPLSDPLKAWEDCRTKNCFVLFEGKISYCYAPQVAAMAEKKFGHPFDMGKSLADIYDGELTGESLLAFLRRPHECCAYCGVPETCAWSLSDREPKLSDWLVDKPIR